MSALGGHATGRLPPVNVGGACLRRLRAQLTRHDHGNDDHKPYEHDYTEELQAQQNHAATNLSRPLDLNPLERLARLPLTRDGCA